ncbi:TonB family protein [uncultured Sanguibacteroides sp.]|uniref:TonB family protein n=1 Tax=uncultured Sanguibacteroides sp. TaxID=1635151 RepID=UPI0025F9F851|nr:TonB family protein [uncultured Sanguibacteroides sp.]
MNHLKMYYNLAKTGIVLGMMMFVGYMSEAQAAGMRLVDEDTTICVVVDQNPVFKGNMNQWIGENVVYPEDAKKEGIEGRVYISFIVEKDGSITHVMVARSVHPLLDEEGVRVMSMMPKWSPALLEGKPVRFMMTYPITFKMQVEEAPQLTYEQYIENLAKEKEALATEKALPAEEQAKRVEGLKKELGDDATVYDLMLNRCNEIKGEIDSRVKEEAKILKLKKADAKLLAQIYQKEIDGKIALINNFGKDQFISKYVAGEVGMRKLEFDKIVEIQSLLKDKFKTYFEQIILK